VVLRGHPVPAEGGESQHRPVHQRCDQAHRVELEGKSPRDYESCGNRMDLAVIRQEKLITDELVRDVCDQT
jgi:hypothetical protein